MKQKDQSVFILEELQPGWLERKRDLVLYTLVATVLPWLPTVVGLTFLVGSQLGASVVLALATLGAIDGIAQAVLKSQETASWRMRTLRAMLIFVGVTAVCSYFLSATLSFRKMLLYSSAIGFWGAASGFASHAWNANSRIRPFEAVTWSWRNVARNLTCGFLPIWPVFMMLLGNSLVVASSVTIINELGGTGGPFVKFPELWPALAVLIFFAFAGFSGTTSKVRNRPNQGIWLSGKHGLIFGFTGTAVSFLPFLLLMFESQAYASEGKIASTINAIMGRFGNWRHVSIYLGFSVALGFCLGLVNGGLDFIRHFLLRPVLALRDRFPLNIVRFLDFAAERILLYKVGGGYVFIHRLLLEHFAALEEEPGRLGRNLTE